MEITAFGEEHLDGSPPATPDSPGPRAPVPSIVTDWRETNLLSSCAWRGLGYRDTFTRVHRLVGH